MPKTRKRLFLIDGHSLAFRSFFAIRDLTTSKGEHVNAVFGFTKTLLMLLRDEQPDYIAVAFDTAAPTFRHEQFAEYKANRAETPEEFAPQVPLIQDVLAGFRIPVLTLDGYEADDILVTLARRAVAEGLDAVIVTHDKDLMQAVNRHITILNPHGGAMTPYDAAKVKEKYGVRPDQIVDWLALMGDSVDNIPGVPGIGQKTAAQLLQEFGTLDAVLANIDKVSGKKRKENLTQYADQARASRELAVIPSDVPIGVEPEDCVRREIDRDALAALFARLEFRSITRDVLGEEAAEAAEAAQAEDAGGAETPAERSYTTVTTASQLKGLIRKLKKAQRFCVDLETTSTDPMLAEPVGIALSCRAGEAYYIPVGHAAPDDLLESGEAPEQLPLAEALDLLRPLLEDPAYAKVGQNIKYDLTVLAEAGVEARGAAFDTMVAAGLLWPDRLRYKLESLAEDLLGLEMIPIQDLIGKGKNQITMAQVPVERAAEYACEDADVTWRLHEVLGPQLEAAGLAALFHDVEMPLVDVLTAMERTGICVDTAALGKLHRKIQRQLETLAADIYAAAGREFNINSTQQLGQILFEELGLKGGKRTKTGYSTDSSVLERLSSQHALPGLVLEYRGLSKLDSTYVQTLPGQVNPKTNRVHTSYNQVGAATGRLSSKDPNLQNIPIRTPLGREVRAAFVARDAQHVLLSADYSQIELRVLAHITEDPTLIAVFQSGTDVHAETSSKIFGVPVARVTADQRRKAKIANFGLMYGMGPVKLAADMGISRTEAQDFIEHYFAVYPGIKTYMDRAVREGRERGYVSTILDRRRALPDLQSSKPQLRSLAERAAINTPIQGSAADIIKLAMVRLSERLADFPAWRMLLQVHDELVFELPITEVDQATDVIRDAMATAYPLRVPLVVDIGVGRSWLDAHE